MFTYESLRCHILFRIRQRGKKKEEEASEGKQMRSSSFLYVLALACNSVDYIFYWKGKIIKK